MSAWLRTPEGWIRPCGRPPIFIVVKPFESLRLQHDKVGNEFQADFWYDTKCPNCNAGIEWQRRRLVRAARAGVGAEVADVRRRLHAVDAEGRLHVGAICAIAIWLRTPRDVWLGRVLSLPVIHSDCAPRHAPVSAIVE